MNFDLGKKLSNSVYLVREHREPKISVIIPSLDGIRGGNVPEMIRQILETNEDAFEILIVKAVSPNGRARDEGVKVAKGQYYVFMDDDVQVGSKNLLSALITPLEKDPLIGMTGASYLLPPGSPKFQRDVAAQLARVECPVSPFQIESDMVCHACLAVSAKTYREAGGENRDIISGTDPDFKARIRDLGLKIVIVANTWVYMPTYENLRELCRKSYQGGKNSIRMQRWYPHLVQLSTTTLGEPNRRPVSAPMRVIAYWIRFGKHTIQGQWIALANQFFYLLGAMIEWLLGPRKRPSL